MKAWEVKNKYEGFNAEIVFATTAGKAKTLALSVSEDNLDDSNFCDLEAHRVPELDKYYKPGKTHMDWCEPKDRLVLVEKCDYYCSDECFSIKEFYKCIANKYCQRYKDYVERNKEKCFENHKATLTDYGNVKILDFKNPNSFEYRIRFLFEEDYYRLHISGDLGELTATNYCNMTYEKFSDMVRDVGYFEGKINCHSRPLYIYDEDAVKEDILELIKEKYGLEELIEDYRDYDFYSNEEVMENFYHDIFSDFSDKIGISSEARKILAKYIGDYDAYSEDIGKRKTDILDWYMFAFKLAQKQLNNAEKNMPAVETEKHAHWIDVTTEDDDEPLFKCSNCGNKGGQWNYNCDYCPDCGYKMEKSKGE